MHYDLCLPWYWEYDIDFVQLIERACREHGLAFWQITPDNLLESITALYTGEKSFRAILDRSQYDPRFEPIHRWSREHSVLRINPAEVSKWSEDKATMHLELITAGIHTPYTILLPPFVEQPVNGDDLYSIIWDQKRGKAAEMPDPVHMYHIIFMNMFFQILVHFY